MQLVNTICNFLSDIQNVLRVPACSLLSGFYLSSARFMKRFFFTLVPLHFTFKGSPPSRAVFLPVLVPWDRSFSV